MHLAFVAKRIHELREDIPKGGPREAVIRALLYVRMPEGAVDERAFNLIRRMRHETGGDFTLSEFKKLLREQFFMLTLDEQRAVEAIPGMLAKDRNLASELADKLLKIISVVGVQREESRRRLTKIEGLFEDTRKPSEAVTEMVRPTSSTQPAHAHGSRTPKHH
jgi:hypothetical protein